MAKPFKYGEPTTHLRVPVSKVSEVVNFMEKYLVNGNGNIVNVIENEVNPLKLVLESKNTYILKIEEIIRKLILSEINKEEEDIVADIIGATEEVR